MFTMLRLSLRGARKKNRNTILERVLVTDYAAEGRSLARVDGKVIFIDDSVPGDTWMCG